MEPGTPAWLAVHGIDPEIWLARGAWRYEERETNRVKAAFRDFLPATRLGTITKIVNQSAGIVMPKSAPPGFPAVIPQLRPDQPVVLDDQPVWHYHGAGVGGWPVYPPAAGDNLAGRKLTPVRKIGRLNEVSGAQGKRWGYVISPGLAEAHISRSKSPPYDPETGEGDHRGVNLDVVHFHVPHAAKYVLLGSEEGSCKRIDMQPIAVERLRGARRLFFVLEGVLKNDALLSAEEVVASVPSVTLWDPDTIRRFARWIQEVAPRGLVVYVVPDADWIENDQVIRQAMFVRACFRSAGVHAEIAAPPAIRSQPKCACKPVGRVSRFGACRDCGGYLKGLDDFMGGGGSVEQMQVRLVGAPLPQVAAWSHASRRLRVDRLARAHRAIVGLSEHDEGDGLYVPMNTLARIMGVRKRALVQTLEDIGDAVEIEGDLATEVGKWSGVLDWREGERPRVRVRDDFRAQRSTLRLDDHAEIREGEPVTKEQADAIIVELRGLREDIRGAVERSNPSDETVRDMVDQFIAASLDEGAA